MVLLHRQRVVTSVALLPDLILIFLGWDVCTLLRVLVVNVRSPHFNELKHRFLAAAALLVRHKN